jgi:hypothetical protein
MDRILSLVALSKPVELSIRGSRARAAAASTERAWPIDRRDRVCIVSECNRTSHQAKETTMIRFLLSKVAGESRREVARVEGRRTRRLAPRIEGLEDRELLSTMWASPSVGDGSGSGSGSHVHSPHSPPPPYR